MKYNSIYNIFVIGLNIHDEEFIDIEFFSSLYIFFIISVQLNIYINDFK